MAPGTTRLAPVPDREALLRLSVDPLNRFYRYPLARLLVRPLVRTPVTPNQVTWLHMAVGLVAAWFVTRGTHGGLLVACVLYELRMILDCLDGVLARAKKIDSPFGRAADEAADIATFLALLVAIGFHERSAGRGLAALPWIAAAFVTIAAIAGAYAYYRRKFSSALRTGTDAVRGEFLAHYERIRSGRGGVLSRLSFAIDWLELSVLSPGSASSWMREEAEGRAKTGEVSEEVRSLIERSGSRRIRWVLVLVSLLCGDNALFLIHVGLAAGFPVLGLALAIGYGWIVFAFALAATVSFLRVPARRQPAPT
ncbi:MAG: CDP-alcohol phosphatidyltransferase family protein [Planctomycetes bacterium]|nr:CDP-alcohol phosphatidyltransferase family protein [Planctomycetota bacterium]